jgi:hypothetical protein
MVLKLQFPGVWTSTKIHHILCTFSNSSMYYVRTMYNVCVSGSFQKPIPTSARIVFAFYWLFSVVIYATYAGNLVAFLSVSKPELPFRTIREMSEQNQYTYGVLGGTFLHGALGVRQSTHTHARTHARMYARTPHTLLIDFYKAKNTPLIIVYSCY